MVKKSHKKSLTIK